MKKVFFRLNGSDYEHLNKELRIKVTKMKDKDLIKEEHTMENTAVEGKVFTNSLRIILDKLF